MLGLLPPPREAAGDGYIATGLRVWNLAGFRLLRDGWMTALGKYIGIASLDTDATRRFFCAQPGSSELHPSMPPSPEIKKRPGDVLSVAVIGNDTMLAALPAHPVQLAHGCHLLGYHTVVPASWGDELVADAVIRDAGRRGRRPAIVCACERARARLTTGAGELTPYLISTISPPVAAARHLRALLAGRRLDITFVGDCASGADPVFDARYSPDVFLVRLRSAGIDLRELPTHFDNLMPPDRRRHASLPGGCPTAEALARACPDRELIELTEGDLAAELAEQLFAQDTVLLDVAAGVGCACAGVRQSGSARTARVAVMSLEPPRSMEPIIDGVTLIDVSASSPPPVKLTLLPRDPNADAVQAVLPAPARDESTPSYAQQEEMVAGSVSVAELDPWETESEAPPLRRPFAITPPRALHAVASARAATRLAPQPPEVKTPTPDPAPASARALEVVADAPRPIAVEPEADEPRSRTESAPPAASVAVAAPLRVLAEDPIAATHRAAQARIRSHVRPVPPPPTDAHPWRTAMLWSVALVAAIILAIAVLVRGR